MHSPDSAEPQDDEAPTGFIGMHLKKIRDKQIAEEQAKKEAELQTQ